MTVRTAIVTFLSIGVLAAFTCPARASTILGTGAGSLVGGDLTDPEDDGASDADVNYNATFFANDEPAFGGGEFSFNVFDGDVGGGNAKWCCGPGGASPFPLIVGASFGSQQYQLNSFTLTSSNDSPPRDPRVWSIEGSNDTTTGLDGTWTAIYSRTITGSSDWSARNQVIRYSAGDGDTFLTTAGFTDFRLNTTATGATSGAYHALNEIELFGTAVPEPTTFSLTALGLLGLLAWGRRRRC